MEIRPSVVLVHGAFADGSSWDGVIRHLQHLDYPATAVQIAEYSLADDITTTQRVIDAQKAQSYSSHTHTEAQLSVGPRWERAT